MASDAMYAIQWDGSHESVDFIKQCLHQHRIGVFYINISDFHQTMTKAEREGKVYFHPYIALAKGDAYVRMERTDWVIYGQSGVVKVYPDSAKCAQFMTNENLLPETEPEEPTQPEEDMNPEDYNPEDPINDDEGLDHNDIQDPEGDYTGEENTDIDIDVEVTPGTPEGDNDVVVWPKDPDILSDEDLKDVIWSSDEDDEEIEEVTDETPDDDQA